jgi:hypothetical protein
MRVAHDRQLYSEFLGRAHSSIAVQAGGSYSGLVEEMEQSGHRSARSLVPSRGLFSARPLVAYPREQVGAIAKKKQLEFRGAFRHLR